MADAESLPDPRSAVKAPTPRETTRRRHGFGAVALLLVVPALLAPLSTRVNVTSRVGVLLVLAAVLEFAHGFRRSTLVGQRAAWSSGAITLGMGLLLINAPAFAAAALLLGLAGWFELDALRYGIEAVRRARAGRSLIAPALGAAGNLIVALLVMALRGQALAWTVALAGALRIGATAWNIVTSPVYDADDSRGTVVDDLALPDRPELAELAGRITEQESARTSVDRAWVLGFLATLLAIHVGRMGFDRTFLGITAPGFAVLGDVFLALLMAFVVVIPLNVAWLRLTRVPERWLWSWYLDRPASERGWLRQAVGVWLTRRLRAAMRLRRARYSLRSALSRGIQTGLPLAAIVAATVPVWGMSWYFDTENWAAGVWNSWAEERADTWREAMTRAVVALEAGPAPTPERAFAVAPPGVAGRDDFAFIVIGDTGEGDASQHSLRDALLRAARLPDVRFLVVSSDVIYPAGAMKDFEANFWLPFMGVECPVYAIPGNHDWFDALEAFNATFLEPRYARAALHARVEVDNRLTSTTDRRMDELVATASRLKQEYRVPTQLQKAPFFQVQTDAFALLAIDTGVARTLDPVQKAWLEAALADADAKGKTIMAILGHPFYAGGHDTAAGQPEFEAIHALLRRHHVAIIMAGDTHDLEHYVEPLGDGASIQHFVNGGGGAYLSFGTALDWPAKPVTDQWAFYPSRDAVVAKITTTSPLWKKPAWWWTSQFGGWPFSAEWLSAAFDYNVAPFYQSFIEVRVEPSRGRLRLIPHGIHGPLRWRELQTSPSELPRGISADQTVEWIVPMRPGR